MHYNAEKNEIEFTPVECFMCSGLGTKENFSMCKNQNRAQRGKPCEICGAKTRFHSVVSLGVGKCQRCDGTGKNETNAYSTFEEDARAEYLKNVSLRVLRTYRENTWNENYLGLGCIYSCTDYGRIASENDETVKAKVLGELKTGYFQVLHFLVKDGEKSVLADELLVIVTTNGYSVRGAKRNDKTGNQATGTAEPGEQEG